MRFPAPISGLLRQASTLALLAVCAATPRLAHALERITLRNGFTYDCTRQEPLADNGLRLYLLPSEPSPALPSPQLNYIDLPAGAVVSVEELPDPPKPVVTPAKPVSDAHKLDLGPLLHAAGAAHDIDVELLASVIHAESGGRAGALSRAGAVGLMQLMPSTALSLGVLHAELPDQNIDGGTAYLDALLTRYRNNLALALAAYNAGPGAVDRYHGIPPFRETRAYVVRVMTEFKRRKLELARNEHPR